MQHFNYMGFLFLLLLMVCGVGYVSWHIWQVLPWPAVWRWVAVGTGIGAFTMLFVSLFRIVDRMPMCLATPVYEVGTSSIIALLYLFLTFLLLDIGRLVRLVPREWLYSNGWTAGTIAVIVGGLLIAGNIIYNNKVRTDIHITTNKSIRRELKIVMASDLHLGYHHRRDVLRKWVDMINAEKADLILFGGDLIDMSHRPLREDNMAAELLRLNAPTYACMGNHECISGTEAAQNFYREAGIMLLTDSVAEEYGIYIVGRKDRMLSPRKSIKELTDPLDHRRFILVLDHQPYHLERTEKAGADFQFSGHTHRGQVWPISMITDAVYEKSFGPHQRGDTHYYISSGLGIWGGKYRIGTQSEYVVLTIS